MGNLKLIDKLHKKWLNAFPDMNTMEEEMVKDCKTLLDVGCGEHSGIGYFKKKPYSVGVELFEEALKKSKKSKIHDKYLQIDAMDVDKYIPDKSFDCVMLNAVIEHIEKEEGKKLIKKLEKIAKKIVIISTSNGFIAQGAADNNPWQVHKSGWTVEEMRERGYKVIGIEG
jgi:2-polyprenyl-3-methyl-5-hydroxy-6-metoxy-1,4-benzoquinol methylase